ncbi:YceI family protein [Aquabacter sp. CN5-332]|uniref:YceI family protein n=1 Tax=Aquabacter sp. CN5-332 TaxID=3156608 RepID=UPI0032B60889
MKIALLSAFAAAFCLAAPLQAQEVSSSPTQVRAGTYAADPGHTRVTWSISHLGYSTYSGIFPAVTGTLVLDENDTSKSRVDVTIPVERVGTLDPDLDKHLKAPDFLDVAKFPTATFKSTGIKAAGRTAKITGDLTLRGVTKPVTLDVTFNQAGVAMDKLYTVGFDATAVIKRSDFGMTTYLPVLGDAVTLRIEAEFKAK